MFSPFQTVKTTGSVPAASPATSEAPLARSRPSEPSSETPRRPGQVAGTWRFGWKVHGNFIGKKCPFNLFFNDTWTKIMDEKKLIRMVIEHAKCAISEQHRDVAVELHVWHQNRWSSHGLYQIVLLERTLSDVMLRHFCMFISPACPTPWLGCRYSILASPSSFLCWIPHYCMVTKMRPALLPQIDSYVFPFHSIKIHMISPYTS